MSEIVKEVIPEGIQQNFSPSLEIIARSVEEGCFSSLSSVVGNQEARSISRNLLNGFIQGHSLQNHLTASHRDDQSQDQERSQTTTALIDQVQVSNQNQNSMNDHITTAPIYRSEISENDQTENTGSSQRIESNGDSETYHDDIESSNILSHQNNRNNEENVFETPERSNHTDEIENSQHTIYLYERRMQFENRIRNVVNLVQNLLTNYRTRMGQESSQETELNSQARTGNEPIETNQVRTDTDLRGNHTQTRDVFGSAETSHVRGRRTPVNGRSNFWMNQSGNSINFDARDQSEVRTRRRANLTSEFERWWNQGMNQINPRHFLNMFRDMQRVIIYLRQEQLQMKAIEKSAMAKLKKLQLKMKEFETKKGKVQGKVWNKVFYDEKLLFCVLHLLLGFIAIIIFILFVTIGSHVSERLDVDLIGL